MSAEVSPPISTPVRSIILYAAPLCSTCRRVKRWLDAHGIPYEEINLARDMQTVAMVKQLTDGWPHVPTIMFPDGSVLVEPSDHELAARCFPGGEMPGQRADTSEIMCHEGSSAPVGQEISYPRFAAFYNPLMGSSLVRKLFDPLRREIVGQAYGVVLEVGVGGGQNFPFYEPSRVERVEAIEPDEAMLVEARKRLATAPIPIHLSRASVDALPFPDAQFDSVVGTLVFCSVCDPLCGLREIERVLKPGGTLVLLEHVRAPGKRVAWIQDALVPLTTRCLGNCHWNRNTEQMVLEAGFQTTEARQLSGGLQPMLRLAAIRPATPEELPPKQP